MWGSQRSTKRRGLWKELVFAFALWLALEGFEEGSQAATLIYSNDVLGELEPCGCRNNPSGGLPRKGVLLDQTAAKSKDDLLQLDAGDLLFETDIIPEPLAAQRELQAKKLARAHADLGHDAVVPGEKDFARGTAFLKSIAKSSKLRFLAANLTQAGKPVFEANAIFEKKKAGSKEKLRIGVFGIVGENLGLPKDLKVTPTIAAAREQVKFLQSKKVDRIIALTHQGYEKDLTLAKAVPGIDIIVGGHTQSFLQKPDQEGRTTILQSSFRNQYIGVTSIDGKITETTHRLVSLDESFEPAKHPDSPRGKKMNETVAELKAEIAKLNDQEAVQLKQLDSMARTPHDYQTFARCAECHLKQFEFWRKTPHTGALQVLIDAGQHKNKDCLTCHTVGLGDPKGFSGPAEIATIKKSGKTEPLPIEELGRFLKEMIEADKPSDSIKLVRSEPSQPLTRALSSIDKAWAPVQCENCHGPAGGHPFSSVAPYVKAVANETCLKCHTAERAPSWYQAGKLSPEVMTKKRPLVTCPPGDLDP